MSGVRRGYDEVASSEERRRDDPRRMQRAAVRVAVLMGRVLVVGAAVAVLAPETAAKPAVAKTVATAKPPGNLPSHLLAASNNDFVNPA